MPQPSYRGRSPAAAKPLKTGRSSKERKNSKTKKSATSTTKEAKRSPSKSARSNYLSTKKKNVATGSSSPQKGGNKSLTPTLKVYTQNVCVLPVGGRESLLQFSSMLGTIFLPILIIANLYESPIKMLAVFGFLIVTGLACPAGYYLAAPFWLGSNLFSRKGDYKSGEF